MQETRYGIRLAQEDFRWMLGEADLGNVLAPFSKSAVAPVSLEASSQPQLALRSALYTLSVDINALTQEQVRLRETLETLNSTLFISSDSLSPKSANTQTSALKEESTGPVPAADKSAGDELLDTARDKIVEKLIDLVFDGAVKQFKGRKKNSRPKAPLSGPPQTQSLIPGGSQQGVHAGAPSQGFQFFAGARSPAPAPPSVASSALKDALAKLESVGIRRLAPLRTAEAAVDVIQGVSNGDSHAVAGGLSTAGGAWAGASAGAAIGTLVLPGVGTAVGGVIGGLLGSEAGAWMGDKLFGSPDRLPAPNAVSKELNSARADSVQVSIAPSIQITGVNPADAQLVVNQVIQALQFQCMPMVTDSLGLRRNAALADPSGGD
ncbi:hypothetical protein HU746_05450 [Pseudomonas lurida]|jgi:hypothetical protein|uniref:glycine zipper domain-containing protein n=1 Tax=Pseudomonas lurida TaxID=244566 RepID=UPI0016477BA4|nr:glycine zipper domain-containing protein [Pseudomonas lurida]MBC3244089.1 hypothetical protein [Pseudomonas lurida]MBC3922319.1 hypothetical protein [Pseudomonas lurida]MCF5024441.1 hypothetical protein [Pseudomonas lurida]MCF5309500.1 hypothetical protein [Pseudomonas lurida]MCF5323228.1 hypothetical protein [Pseudomonas lurida]